MRFLGFCIRSWMGLPLGVVALWAFLGLPAAAQVNMARNQPAISSGANWGGLTPAALTDGVRELHRVIAAWVARNG